MCGILILVAGAVCEQSHSAQKEGKAQAALVYGVHLTQEIGNLLPALVFLAVVKSQHHKLRRAGLGVLISGEGGQRESG